MSAYRFALVGGGWRSEFYARIARKMPEKFHLTATWVHSPEKAEAWRQRFGGRIAGTPADVLREPVDFAVVALNKQYSFPYVMEMLGRDVPLLLETPPAVQLPRLFDVWEAVRHRRAPVYVAEQYPDQPYFQAWQAAVDQGLLGPVSSLRVSMAHGYHAMALIRAFLKVGGESARISGQSFRFPVQKTGDRSGLILDGETHLPLREQAVIAFDSGKTAFYDFCGEQYHSAIRFSHFSVQGEKGEISDNRIRYLNDQGYPVEEKLARRQYGVGGCSEYRFQGITLGERWLVLSPFPLASLGDDEIAVAVAMQRMGRIARGERVDGNAYSLSNALQDAYLAACMRKAIDSAKPIDTQAAPWQDALKGRENYV